jgi:putative resolvase
MKLSTWAKQQDIHYMTAWRWFHQGILPFPATQLPTGTIIIHTEAQESNTFSNKTKRICIYGRVSSHNKKDDLERQIQRCCDFAAASGKPVDKIYKEVASGMNDKRRELFRMIDSDPTIIIVEHKDRLTRFGFNYLEQLLKKLNCEIIVINKDVEDEKDLMKDMISIITSFCCRLYGLRRGKTTARKIKNIVE